MAIVIAPPPADANADAGLEAIIVPAPRPAILIRDGTFNVDAAGEWAASLDAHRPVLEQAIRGVGRLETEGGLSPFAGTAFLFRPRWAVTANFVAQALSQRPSAASASVPSDRLEGVWLNLGAEVDSGQAKRIAVRNVHFVHPYWGFSFLELEHDVDPATALPLPVSAAPPSDALEGRHICVIGYPASDARETPEYVKALFGDVFGVKRLMPGRLSRSERWGSENALALTHDATTMGGTSGAPLIDLASGSVIGIHVAGASLVANYAVPAWELCRDPQWAPILNAAPANIVPDAAATRRQVIGAAVDETPIYSFDEINELQRMFIKIGVTEDDDIKGLLVGLPPEYVATLPNEGAPADRLRLILHTVNETGGVIRGHSAFYYLLVNGKGKRSWDEAFTKKMETLLADLQEREKQRV